jgi:hypothetical protein
MPAALEAIIAPGLGLLRTLRHSVLCQSGPGRVSMERLPPPLLLLSLASCCTGVATATVSALLEPDGAPKRCGFAPPYPSCTATYPRQGDFNVSVVERDPYGKPLISFTNGDSIFPFNFNVAWFPAPEGSDTKDGLIVRVQEACTPNCPQNTTHPEWMDIGALTAVKADVLAGTVEHIDESLVF